MDKFERLKELKKLLDDGIITPDEFNVEKRKVLNDEETKPASDGGKLAMNDRKRTLKWVAYSLAAVLLLIVIAFIFNNVLTSMGSKKAPRNPTPFVNVYFEEEEVFPVYLLYLRNTKQGLMDFTITNPTTESKTVHVSYGFSEFGKLDSLTVKIESGSVEKVSISPYSDQLMGQVSPINATLILKVTDEQNTNIFTKSWTLRVNPGDEIPWIVKNRDCTNLIASWVTPENRSVDELMSKVKQKTGGNVKSVESLNNEEFKELVKAIFNTVRDEKMTYINNPISFGAGYSQRIRLPELSLKNKSANSIDGSVLLASLFENAGLRPFIVILLDHSIVGVARPNQLNDRIYIETTLLGRSTLENILTLESAYTAATKKGKVSYNMAYDKFVNKESGRFNVIDVYKARQDGILPIR